MTFAGFTETDFDTFHIEGLDGRMAAIKAGPRPKLEALGALLAPELERLTERPFFAHIARHARRKVNPPTDTWVAFSANKRGYKMAPHFQVGLWSSHLFIQAGVIYEAQERFRFGANLLQNLSLVKEAIPGHFRWLENYMKPEGVRHESMADADFERLADRLQHRKQADAMVGVNLAPDEAIALGGDGLLRLVRETFHALLPVYLLAR